MASSEVRIDPFQNHELISAYSEFAWPIVTLIFFFVILYFTGFTLQKWTAAQTIHVTSMEFVQMPA